ncbi:MAG: hypothetical protein IV100_24250 [Myxococcales bacterium]|nr:hypothetical protein [Myxococcales bacterium]
MRLEGVAVHVGEALVDYDLGVVVESKLSVPSGLEAVTGRAIDGGGTQN